MSSLQMKSIAFVTFPYSHKLKTSLTSNLIWAELSVYDHLKVNEELEKYSAHITGVPFYVVKHPFLLSLDLCFGMQKVR